jgi:Cytochrome P460
MRRQLDKGTATMKAKSLLFGASISIALATLAAGAALSAQDRYTLKVPGGLALAEFRGYLGWQPIALSRNGTKVALILGNRAMIDAFKAGIPGNGQPFPDGAKMAKIHWEAIEAKAYPGAPTVPGTLHDTDFMVKDSKRFADSGGWGYAEFEYDDASGTFRPGNLTDKPAQGNDAKCGAACHTIVKNRDYVFTQYAKR